MKLVPRRLVLKAGFGTAGAMLLPLHLPVLAESAVQAGATVPEAFVPFSSAMTGIAVDLLDPPVAQDNTRLAETYYTLLSDAASDATSQALDWYASMVSSGHSPQEISNFALSDSTAFDGLPESAKPAARLTMMLWLFGAWYGGTEVQNKPDSKNHIGADYQTDFVVSGRAYVNGWIWRIAQAHPMGYSQFKFGSWATEPPSLRQYGIDI